MLIDQGHFHIVDNDLTFTKTRELVHFPKYAEPHLSRFVDFIIDLSLSQVPIIKAG